DRWRSPAERTRRHLVGWRACRGAGRNRPASTRRPHSRPAPRSTATFYAGARGRLMFSRAWRTGLPRVVLLLQAGNAFRWLGFAFVDRPWQAFACAVIGGAGVGVTRTANQTLLITLITPEQRVASFALGRAAQNLGLGLGTAIAGFVISSAQDLRSFQALYLFDAITYAALALVVLAVIPNQRAGPDTGTGEGGFREVARDRRFLIVIAVNLVLI